MPTRDQTCAAGIVCACVGIVGLCALIAWIANGWVT